jgi:uncharacterized protein (TIGR02001 family)
MKMAFRSGRGARPAPPCFWVIALCAGAGADAASVGAGGSVVATTDYVYRGLTHSGRKPALQADGHLQLSSGWFAGAWGSWATSVPATQSRSEVNLYAGRAWVLSPDWTASAHYARYLYPDKREWVRYFYDDYDELQMAVSYQDRASLSVAYAPHMQRYGYGPVRARGRQLSYEASLRQPLWKRLNVTAGFGYYDVSNIFDGSYWACSAGMELGWERLTMTLSHFQVDGKARRLFGAQSADGTWTLTAAW